MAKRFVVFSGNFIIKHPWNFLFYFDNSYLSVQNLTRLSEIFKMENDFEKQQKSIKSISAR